MKRAEAGILVCFFCTSAGMHGQDYDIQGYINEQGNAEAQAIADGLSGAGQSVVDTVANNDTAAGITGNDYVEGALGKGVQALGGGVLSDLPIADGSAALGSYFGGDNQAAADTAVAGTMGAIAGWGAGSLVTTMIAGGVITVSGPAWIPGVIVGGTVGWLTKSAIGWILHPDPSGSAPTPAPTATGRKPHAHASTGSTQNPGPVTTPAQPFTKPMPPSPVGPRDRDGGGHGHAGHTN